MENLELSGLAPLTGTPVCAVPDVMSKNEANMQIIAVQATGSKILFEDWGRNWFIHKRKSLQPRV